MRLNEDGIAIARKPRSAAAPVRVPTDLAAALKENADARAAFAEFSPSHKREYVERITGAKAADTRARRLVQAIAWIAEGKSRNWKYERK